MTRRSGTVLLGLAIAVVAAIGWFAADLIGPGTAADEPRGPRRRTIGRDLGAALERAKARAALPWSVGAPRAGDTVMVAGAVIDAATAGPVGGVEVVFRSPAGDETTTAGPDGKYRIELPPGLYRAFVRDETVLSVGRGDRIRVPGMPSADTAGVPDEALMPLVVASADLDGIDLTVIRGGVVVGHVVDLEGRPIANAVVRARGGGPRPTLGTDVAESDAAGNFELRLAAGDYLLEATHARFAGAEDAATVKVVAGAATRRTIAMLAGCVVSGRVTGSGGRPANDGAIERRWGTTDREFAPSGRIGSDGSFRWVTTEAGEVTLRAWPWKSPPSQPQTFACRDGARFDRVSFAIPDRAPDIDGVLVDSTGAPLAFAFIDLAPLDPGGIGQQERTDGEGKWNVFHMPVGRYRVSAHAPGRGVVSQVVSSPQSGVRLQLAGTGRIEGTSPLLADGSFELELRACIDGGSLVALPEASRLVAVDGGRFTIDDVPACDLQITAIWHGREIAHHVAVPAGGVASLELALGPPRAKQVHGVVRDAGGAGVAGVTVSARFQGDAGNATTTTDASGRFSLRSYAGATIVAARGGRIAFGEVGMANVDEERVDLVLADLGDGRGDEPDPPPTVDP